MDLELRIAAVIVSYNPDLGFVERVREIADQVEFVVVVDNGSDERSLIALRAWMERASADVQLIRSESNAGVASALNVGVTAALARGALAVATFDHDSLPAPDMIDQLARNVGPGVGIVAPNRVDANDSREVRFLHGRPSRLGFRVSTARELMGRSPTFVITSGSLIPASTFVAVGQMNESLFIDQVDTEFCLRVRAKGLRIVVCEAAVLQHALGDKQSVRRAGVRGVPTNHSPLRRYYRYRNAVWLIRTQGRRNLDWVSFQLVALLRTVAQIIWFESDRLSKLRACLWGLWDGWRAELGPARRF